jgi:hypothetical protein
MSNHAQRQKVLTLFSFVIVAFLLAARPLQTQYVTTTVGVGRGILRNVR